MIMHRRRLTVRGTATVYPQWRLAKEDTQRPPEDAGHLLLGSSFAPAIAPSWHSPAVIRLHRRVPTEVREVGRCPPALPVAASGTHWSQFRGRRAGQRTTASSLSPAATRSRRKSSCSEPSLFAKSFELAELMRRLEDGVLGVPIAELEKQGRTPSEAAEFRPLGQDAGAGFLAQPARRPGRTPK